MIRRSSINFLFFFHFFPLPFFSFFLKIFFAITFFFSYFGRGRGGGGARWWEGRQGFNGSSFSNESFKFEP